MYSICTHPRSPSFIIYSPTCSLNSIDLCTVMRIMKQYSKQKIKLRGEEGKIAKKKKNTAMIPVNDEF